MKVSAVSNPIMSKDFFPPLRWSGVVMSRLHKHNSHTIHSVDHLVQVTAPKALPYLVFSFQPVLQFQTFYEMEPSPCPECDNPHKRGRTFPKTIGKQKCSPGTCIGTSPGTFAHCRPVPTISPRCCIQPSFYHAFALVCPIYAATSTHIKSSCVSGLMRLLLQLDAFSDLKTGLYFALT